MKTFWQRISEIIKLSRLEKRWQKTAKSLAIVVVFWTAYMLILPAITMDDETFCGITEHSHQASCYSNENELICELTEHVHEEFCFIKELATDGNVTDGNVTCYNVDGHIHNSKCYTENKILACTEWGKQEPWNLDWESEEFHDKSVKYVTYLINQLPDIDKFENKLERLDIAEDYEGYEEYFKEVYDIASKALVNFENLGPELCEKVPNKADLFEYEWLYSRSAPYAVTETRTVEFVNYYDSATAYKTVLIHSGNVGSYSSFGFYYWYAVVVDENEYGDLTVTAKYDYSLKNKSALAPTTAKGFVLLSHGDSNTFDCEIGDEATVNFDYLNTSGKNTSSFGTVTFSDYFPPAVDIEEDEPIVIEKPSDTQVNDAGGTVTSADRNVVVSKKLKGTEIENVFDITLTVQTKTNVQTFLSEPDMAVVIVMDISNTMNSKYGDTTRYDAAVEAAENFIQQFKANTAGLSQIGFVAFNTSAHEIFSLQPCSTDDDATRLINEMKADTESIIDNYISNDRTRFTNVEGGLKRGYDMLKDSGNSNQYIVFLSDGFPTTYLKDNSADSTNYEGYDPYTPSGTPGTAGVFYDYVMGVHCDYGTSYSDTASIKARQMATTIKDSGAKIFSIGVDVAGQTVQYYVDDSETRLQTASTVERTGTTYEIGDAKSDAAYKNWLGNSIGSGYYYDSTNSAELETAFNNIFAEIIELNGQNTKTVWTATDPLPVLDDGNRIVEFIYFYDKDGNVSADPNNLTGDFAQGAEDTANHKDGIIFWDLKKSGYTTSVDPDDPNTTYYFYSVRYRVRLQNENKGFVEGTVYRTNGNAFLEYRTIVTTDGVQDISESRNVYFPKPAVNGYLSEFSFTKVNNMGSVLPEAEFTLVHDTSKCSICQGNGTSVVDVTKHVQVSNAEGVVSFTSIPSGHIYSMEETAVPDGYVSSGSKFSVTVAYNEITIVETLPDGSQKTWTGINDKVTNIIAGHVLPETGGTGVYHLYIIGGLLILLSSVFLLCLYKKDRKEGRRLRE